MKKLCVLILSVFTLPVFGSGIGANSASAPCTNNTLETYSGNSNLSADWQPNEIQLRWYNGNTLLDVQSSANTCVYDSALTIPSTAPTRVGYTFDGWQVRPEMDFGTIPINVNGNERWAISWENDANRCLYGPNDNTIQVSCASDSTYAELQTYEWKLKFSHGYLYGMSGCSTTAGIEAQRGNPTFLQGTGKYCWCKATGYKPNSSNSINVSLYTLSWVFAYEYGSFAACESLCALACDNFTVSRSYFRTALFTPLN